MDKGKKNISPLKLKEEVSALWPDLLQLILAMPVQPTLWPSTEPDPVPNYPFHPP